MTIIQLYGKLFHLHSKAHTLKPTPARIYISKYMQMCIHAYNEHLLFTPYTHYQYLLCISLHHLYCLQHSERLTSIHTVVYTLTAPAMVINSNVIIVN